VCGDELALLSSCMCPISAAITRSGIPEAGSDVQVKYQDAETIKPGNDLSRLAAGCGAS
jgi:hypothetical protein